MTAEELEALNRRLLRLGLRPLQRSPEIEGEVPIAAAKQVVAAGGQIIRRYFPVTIRVR